jgi:hypothetical protein
MRTLSETHANTGNVQIIPNMRPRTPVRLLAGIT